MNDEQKIRKFETEVLDATYKNFKFYKYSQEIVIPYLLQVYGDTERHRDNLAANGYDPTAVSWFLNNMIHGLGHCIRWITQKDEPFSKDISISSESFTEIHEMAADFIHWGISYHMIAQEFVTWSRGIKTAIINEDKKTIRFLNPQDYNYSCIYDKQLLYDAQMQAVYSSYPHEIMEKEFSKWIKTIDLSKPPIANHIDWGKAKHSDSYPLLYIKISEILFPELDNTTDFEGYNLLQLRQFFTLFFLNFYFIRWIEASLDSTDKASLSFGSNPLDLSCAEFEKLGSIITGLSSEIVRNIILDLTFNPKSFHTSVGIQPFIRSSSGIYYILPNLFSQIEPSRMLLGAINKGSKKKLYDKLINQIEKYNINDLFLSVKDNSNWISHLEKVIKSEGKQIHPDLILIDPVNKSLCVIDYKHFIGPITSSEVDYKITELKKGILQIQKYIDLLKKVVKIGSDNIMDFAINGLLITHKPMPIPVPKGINILITDKETFKTKVKLINPKNNGIDQLLASIKADENPKNISTPFEDEISVNNWKIIRNQHKITQKK